MNTATSLHIGGTPCHGPGALTVRSFPVHELTATSELPLASGSVRAVHVTRALEYLDTPTALRALLEARRVLAQDGRLLIALPDFDRALDGWRRRDPSVFTGAWAEGAPLAPGSLDHRAAEVFCTFSRGDAEGAEPCAAPPDVGAEALRALSAAYTPFRLSLELRKMVIDREERPRFHRRNAWGRQELADMLGLVGFRVRSFDDQPLLAEVYGEGPSTCCVAEPVEAPERCPRAHYRLLWDLHERRVKRSVDGRARRPDPGFSRLGYRQGRLTGGACAALKRALTAAPAVPLTLEDFLHGYAYNAGLSPSALEAINADHTFLRLDAAARGALGPVLEELKSPLEECMGTPFCVVNVRCWTTRPMALATEANAWHNDELYPPSVLKVMIYLSGAGPEVGSTELVLRDGSRVRASGPPGTFLLFENFALLHRGVSPTTAPRAVLELTVAPSLVSDLRPVYAGLNAEFPWLPPAAREGEA